MAIFGTLLSGKVRAKASTHNSPHASDVVIQNAFVFIVTSV